MPLVNIILLFVSFTFNSYSDTSKHDVTIVGCAYDDKDGASIKTNDNTSYLLEGISFWD